MKKEFKIVPALSFPNGIFLSCKILSQVDPESKNQINNDGGSDGYKAGIDEIKTDNAGGYTQLFS
jgi:hypothetical protein